MKYLQVPLTSQDLDRLEEYLGRVDGGAIPNVEVLDGFITGLAVCPALVQPSEFLSVIQKGKSSDGDLVFESLREAEEFTGMVMRHWNDVNATLGRNEPHMPILLEDDEGVAHGNDWARGFHEAILLRREIWADIMHDEERSGGMVPILALYYENYPDPALRPYSEPISAEKREDLKVGMIAGALQLYRSFKKERQALASGPRPVRSTKIGPNATCPCGSGKKFKKCCGAVTLH